MYFLKDQDIVEINEEKRARLTFKGKNLFWNPKESIENKILRLLKFGTYNEKEVRQIIGLPSKKIEEGLRHLFLRKLLDIEGTGKEVQDEALLYSLSHNGKTYLRQEEPQKMPEKKSEVIDIREIIIGTEEKLRDLISSVMIRDHGPSWEDDSNIGWSKSKREELEHRMQKRKEEFPTKSHSNRLIDYCYILDLKNIITKNEKSFKPIFTNWTESMTLFDTLGKYRNPPMHSTSALQDYEQSLCIGICGKFNEVIEHWKKGYTRKILSYSCDIRFDVLEKQENDENAKSDVTSSANQFLDKIKSSSLEEVKTETIGDRDFFIIKLKEGIVKISVPTNSRSFYSEGYSQSANIHLSTESLPAFDKIIQIGNRPYWNIKWSISDVLDVHKLINKIEELNGKTPSSKSGTGSGDSVTYTQASYYVLSDGNAKIRIDVGQVNSTSSHLTLVHDGSKFDKGFVNAHEVFSPDEVLAILYGEIRPVEIRKLVQESVV